ncbi:MAG: hypothetical protein HZA53_15075 [Planctomycetes bacterium]|nr:hypothetical protein [Planctomycetota bacterium]
MNLSSLAFAAALAQSPAPADGVATLTAHAGSFVSVVSDPETVRVDRPE